MNKVYPIQNLGECKVASPLTWFQDPSQSFSFVPDDRAIIHHTIRENDNANTTNMDFEAAGPREKIYFDPSKTRVGIVTCGGLCPGINNVIRNLVMQLNHNYGVHYIFGFQYGYEGFIPKYGHPLIELTPEYVRDIHTRGGSILSSSRGHQNVEEIVDCIERRMINILYCIGGDGTLTGAHNICEEIKKRRLKISVVGIPKTIDNDINYCFKTFGFETAFAKAVESIHAADAESLGAPNGIALVKLMGRDSGFIAANTVLACPAVNYVLIPEVPFALEGETGLLKQIENRLNIQKQTNKPLHAVIVVAEGAGQNLFEKNNSETDASGNVRYDDIGILLREQIKKYFKGRVPINLKYIEPSYMIRSLPANPHDSIFCYHLADSAVHAGMAGKTNLMVGYWNSKFTHVPLDLVIGTRKKINPDSDFWRKILACTGQPANM